MANLNDIHALIRRADALEDKIQAKIRYEEAERRLTQHFVQQHSVFISEIMDNLEHPPV